MPEEKLKECPFCGGEAKVNRDFNVDHKSCYFVACETDQCSGNNQEASWIIDREVAIKQWNTRRPAEKLVPLDQVVLYEFIRDWKRESEYEIANYEFENLSKDIYARFASVPVVPDVCWPPDRDIYPPDHEGPFDNHDYAMGWNDRGEADKAAHDKAVKEGRYE